jgi:nitroreductase
MKFLILDTAEKNELARFTHYGHIIKAAAALVLVFLDTQRMYDRDKDLMAIGACIENMLLYIHQKGYGACWLGQILKEKKKVCRHLAIETTLELAAVVAVGKPLSAAKKPRRRTKKQVVLSR